MPLDPRPRTGLSASPIRLALALTLACAALLLAAVARPQAAQAACGGSAVLSGSCFEGGDGNLTADGGLLFADNTDWATIGDELLFSDPASPGTMFTNSSDEQDPTSWSLTSGEPSTNKLDITAAATRVEKIGSDIWMHVGFTMKAAAGSANVLVELNRSGVPAGTNPLPVRSANDALIQFTGNANQAARIGLCQWVGNQFGQGPGGNGAYGWHTTPLPGSLITSSNKDCTQISGGGNPTAVGKVNDGVVLNNLKDETQRVELTGPNAGTFTLTFDGQTTAPISRTATSAAVQSALVALSNIDVADVSVTAPANGGPYSVRFTGAFAATDVPQMTGAGSALLSISTLGQGGASTYLPSPPFAAPTIPADVFGEMSVNLTQALGAGGANPCFNFGSVWLHTYNGNSISSIMADYVVPQSLLGASSCAVSVDKTVAVSQDGVNAPAAGSAYHEGTPADPSSAQVGDYLWYRLALTNSGTAALTPSLTDTGCDLPASPTPIEKLDSSNVADPTPASFDGGDVWTYLCKHQMAAGDPEPYVNTVKAKGIRNSFTTPEVQDSTTTTSDGSLTVKKSFTGPFEAAHRVDLLVGGVVKAASVGDGGATPAITIAGGSSVTFGEAFTVGGAAQYASSASCVDTKRTAGTGDDTPVSASFDAGTLAGSVTVAGRSAILCTITNARRTGTIKVVKDLVPNADAGRFNLSVDGTTRDVASGPGTGTASFGDQSASAALTVATGTHGVAEAGAASPATSLSDYVTSVSCTKNGAAYIAPTSATSLGSLSVAEGDAVVCTFVNTRKGSLKIVKDFSGPFESAHRVTISAAGSWRNVAGGPNGGSANFADLDATAAITVDGGSSNGFSEAYLAPATAGQYTASAECRDGADQIVSSSFSPATLAGTVTVAPGVSVTCTITNARRTGTLKVVKRVIPVSGQLGDPGRFDLQVDGAIERTDAADGDGTSVIVLPTGSHTVGELAGSATTLADYDASVACKDDLGDDVATSDAGSPWSLTLAAGKNVVCTITNARKQGSVKVIKDIVPVDAQAGDPGKFDLSIDGEGDYDATKDEAGDGDSVTLTVPNGTVELSESADGETSLDDYVSSYRCSAEGHDAIEGNGTSISELPVAPGDDWTCTFTNARKQGSVKVIKDIVPVDAQAGDPGKFDLSIDGEGDYDATKDEAGDGDSVTLTVPNGTVELSESADGETSLDDYVSSYRCSAEGHDAIEGDGTTVSDLDVAAGDDWTCTFTNARKQGSVKVIKDIVPVDAQAGDPGKFDLSIDGEGDYDATKDEAGDGDSVTLTVPNGTVELSESADGETSLDDYVSSYRCTAEGHDAIEGNGTSISDLPVAPGDDWTCTFTNARKQGSVKVIKDIVPVDAQAGDPGKFDLSIDGEGDYDATKDEAGDGDSVTLTVPNGTVELSESADGETSLDDYVSSYRCSAEGHDAIEGNGTTVSDLDVAAGDDWTCTFTNARKQGSVKVIKDIVPVDAQAGDPGKFDLSIDGEGDYDATKDEAGDGDSVTLTVPNGTVELSESADGETSLDDYVSSYRCSAEGHDAIEGNGTSISELPVAPGDDWTCTFTNARKQGSVKVIKDIVPVDAQAGDPGKFDLSIDGEGDYDATKDEAGDGDSVTLTVPNGTVELSETADGETSLDDYVSSYRCSAEGHDAIEGNGTSISELPVAPGDDWTCTFTNARKQGSVKVIKDIVPVDAQAGDPGKFDLSIDGEGDYDATKDEAGDGDSVTLTVPNGTVELSETADGETSLDDYVSSYRCTAEGHDAIEGNGTSISELPVAPGDDWTCTFKNVRKQASVRLVKDIIPVDGQIGDPGKFDLSIDGEGDYDATEDEAGDGDFVEISLPSGIVDLSETADGETSLDDYVSSYRCTAEGHDAIDGDGTTVSNLDVAAGEHWTCTFTNTRKQGQVTLVKDIVPVDAQLGDPGKFDLSIDGEGDYDATKDEAGDGDSVTLTVPNGSVDLSEAAGTDTILSDYTSSYRCTAEGHDAVEGDGIAISDLPVAGGDDWTCTLTNVRKQGNVRLTKVIVAVDAQLGDPGKFDLEIDGEGGYDAAKTDAVDGDSIAIDVPNGAVDLSESAGSATSLADYTSSYRCVNTAQGSEDEPVTGEGTTITNLVVTEGDEWHCTFTNTRKKGTVKLVKHIVPVATQLGDPGKFDLAIDGEGAYDGSKDEAGNGDSVTVTVPNGLVDLSETADDETSLGDYLSSYGCEADGHDPITGEGTTINDLPVTAGDEWTCTFTNTRKQGVVKLVKDIVPVDAQIGDSGKFDLSIDGEGNNDGSKNEAGDGDSVTVNVPNGLVDLSETADGETSLSDYTSSYRCVADGHDPVTGDGTSIDDLPVVVGDEWTCTFTNTRKKGTVTVVKQLSPKSDSGLFDLSIDGPQNNDVTGADRGHDGSVAIEVPTGTASVAEAGGTGTTLGAYISSYRCENVAQGEDQPVSGNGTAVQGISVTTGDDWVCTFTNVRKPRVVVKKLTEPAGDDATTFAFTSDLPATAATEGSQAIGENGSFTLKHGQQVGTLVEPGSYSVTEGDVYAQNYKLKGAVCEETVPNDQRFELESNEQSDADRTRSFTADPGDVITCTFVNEKLVGLQVVAKTPKSQSVYIDQNASYSYEVTNTGTADLTDVTVADDKCPGPAVRQADALGDGDAVLEPGEKWVYTCSVAASAIFTGDLTQVTNTVTVNAKDQSGTAVPPSTDTAVTNLLKPGIAIDKTGPATATAGDLITYNLAVTNTGNTVFNDGLVVLADALCQAPPALLSKNGDTSPDTLSPGETWTYSCQVQTQGGQERVDNSGSVTGTDQGGRKATATDTASTVLSQPARQALPSPPQARVPGSAKLRGSVGCAAATYARAAISGKQIKSVTFYVNGKKLRTLTKPSSGSTYGMQVRVRSLRYGTHKVTARVVFVDAARTKSKTLTLQFSRCRPRVVQPKFTG